MNKHLVITIVSIISSSVGGYFGWHFAKKKYEHLADVEVASIKTFYENKLITIGAKLPQTKQEDTPETNKAIIKNTTNMPLDQFTDQDKKTFYDYSKKYRSADQPDRIPGGPETDRIIYDKGEKDPNAPYIIDPNEFKESNYETTTLFYYKDRVVADDDYNVITDIIGTIGDEALETFGRYEEDAVYVRNDILGIDYEILLDERSFYKIAPSSALAAIRAGNNTPEE